jgi:hypothetical protein
MSNKLTLGAVVVGFAALFSSAAQAGMWNAYAVDSQGRYGYAYGYDSRGDAKFNALEGCGISGCKIIMAVESQCIAFADTHEGGYWYGYAYAGDLYTAQNLALGFCSDSGEWGCRIRHSACV